MKKIISIILAAIFMFSAAMAEDYTLSAVNESNGKNTGLAAKLGNIWDSFSGGVGEITDDIAEWFGTARGDVGSYLSDVAKIVLDWAEDEYGTISDTVSESAGKGKTALADFFDKVSEKVSGFINDAQQWFSQIAKEAGPLLIAALQGAATEFVSSSAGNVIDLINGRISDKQLLKNLSVNILGNICGLGGFAGLIGGATLGFVSGPIGYIAGGLGGGILGEVLGVLGLKYGADLISNLFPEDDTDEMLKIISGELAAVAKDNHLDDEETEIVMDRLKQEFVGDVVKDMYASEDRGAFARSMLMPIVEKIVGERTITDLPSMVRPGYGEKNEYSDAA